MRAKEVVRISRREWLFALALALSLIVVLAVPYILGHLLAGESLVFTGIIMNPEDSQSYFAKILQGYEGAWLYSIPFTPEQHEGAFLGGFYLVLGHIARLSSLSIVTIWHVARAVCGLFLFLVTFVFISTFARDKAVRWIAYLVSLLGSGLGWILFLLNQPYWLGAFPIDFKMPEAHLFFSALTFPHVALGTTLILISLLCLHFIGQEHPRGWFLSAVVGITNLALGIIYPFLIYLVIVAYALAWMWLLYRKRMIDWLYTAKLGIGLAIPAPLYIYYIYVNQSSEVFRSWSEQAVTSSPPWPHFLFAFGPLLFLALLTLVNQEEQEINKESRSVLWIWIIAAGILAFAPVNAQRRFIQGVHIPLSILAAVGLVQVVLPNIAGTKLYQKLLSYPRYTEAGLNRLFITAVIFTLAISNIYLLVDVTLTAAVRQPFPFFRHESEFEAIDWLRANTDRNAIVMAAYETGSLIAARAGNRVFIGHWAETVDWEEKFEQTDQFFSAATTNDWREGFLERYQIEFVWHSTGERDLGTFDPNQAQYLRKVFESGNVTLFKVQEVIIKS